MLRILLPTNSTSFSDGGFVRNRIFSLALLSVLFNTTLHSQGWQLLGPDSTNWRYVNRVSGKWASQNSFKLAGATDQGIANYSAGQWSYLKNIPSGPMNIGRSYFYFDFSAWETDSIYYVYADHYTEPSFHFVKGPGFPRAIGRGGCWFTPWGMVFHPTEPVAFASLCGIERSTNGGISWTTLDSSNGIYGSKVVALDERTGQIVYKGTHRFADTTRLYKSRDYGRTWNEIFFLDVSLPIHMGDLPFTVIARGDTILVGVRTLPQTTRHIGVHRSTNGGQTWSRTYSGGRVSGFVRSAASHNTLFAASEEGILKSTDCGATWTIYNNAMPTRRLTSLIISPYSDTMFVSTETHGVLKVWNYLTDVSEKPNVPERTELFQNYPNPFNPTTNLGFRIADFGFVSLKVFDVLGREVATLVNEEMRAGNYEKKFDGSDLASGVYLYRMQAGGFAAVKKFILMR